MLLQKSVHWPSNLRLLRKFGAIRLAWGIGATKKETKQKKSMLACCSDSCAENCCDKFSVETLDSLILPRKRLDKMEQEKRRVESRKRTLGAVVLDSSAHLWQLCEQDRPSVFYLWCGPGSCLQSDEWSYRGDNRMNQDDSLQCTDPSTHRFYPTSDS